MLVRLVRNVSAAAPQESVRIANPTLAAGLHVSERTIYRIKAGLEAKGWITRQQVQSRRRGMQISDVWLTRHALETLGLAGSIGPAAPLEPATDPLQRLPKMADASLFSQSVSQRPPCGALTFPRAKTAPASHTASTPNARPADSGATHLAARLQACAPEDGVPAEPGTARSIDASRYPIARCASASPAPARTGVEKEIPLVEQTCPRPESLDDRSGIPEGTLEHPIRQSPLPSAAHVLPDDVRALAAEGGITVAGVRLLMGLATKAGTRLGHVLQVARDSVFRSRKPFAYVQKLLRTGKDWNALAATNHRRQEEEQQAQASACDLEQLRTAMAEGLYSHAKGKFVWRVEFGAVHQSTVKDAAQGGIGRWLVVHDVSGLAAAWREGKIFRVAREAIEEGHRASDRDSRSCVPGPAAAPRGDHRSTPDCSPAWTVTATA